MRWQPASPLTQWFHAHFAKGKRARRIGIVAVARKLVITLWRYVTTGVVPEGAILKVASARSRESPRGTRAARPVFVGFRRWRTATEKGPQPRVRDRDCTVSGSRARSRALG